MDRSKLSNRPENVGGGSEASRVAKERNRSCRNFLNIIRCGNTFGKFF